MIDISLPRMALFCLSTVTLWFVVFVDSSSGTEIDRVYVVVNEEVVTQSEINRELRNAVYSLRSSGEIVPPLSDLHGQLVERLIDQRLQYQQTQLLGMTLSEHELMDTIRNIGKKNNLSMLQLREEIKKTGRSYADYQQELGRQLLVQRLIEKEITRNIRVSEKEIDQYLESHPRSDDKVEYNLSHVLIEFQEKLSDSRVIAENVRSRLLSGVPFEVIASELSGNILTGNNSDLGWKNLDLLPDLFLEIVRTLDVGDITRPIESQNGFHILRLNARRGGGSYVVDQIRVRQILLKVNEIRDEKETREWLFRIRNRIIGGEDFATIARLHSADLNSRVLGGDLGWLNPGDLEPELERLAATQDLGELSMPIQTQFGYHLIQITDRRNQDIGEQIRRSEGISDIRSEKFNQRYNEWIKELRDKAWIDYRDGREN